MALPVFLGEVPDYECDKAGRVLITIGDFQMVMPAFVFLEGCARGRAAIRRWHEKNATAEIIPFSLSAGS